MTGNPDVARSLYLDWIARWVHTRSRQAILVEILNDNHESYQSWSTVIYSKSPANWRTIWENDSDSGAISTALSWFQSRQLGWDFADGSVCYQQFKKCDYPRGAAFCESGKAPKDDLEQNWKRPWLREGYGYGYKTRAATLADCERHWMGWRPNETILRPKTQGRARSSSGGESLPPAANSGMKNFNLRSKRPSDKLDCLKFGPFTVKRELPNNIARK